MGSQVPEEEKVLRARIFRKFLECVNDGKTFFLSLSNTEKTYLIDYLLNNKMFYTLWKTSSFREALVEIVNNKTFPSDTKKKMSISKRLLLRRRKKSTSN